MVKANSKRVQEGGRPNFIIKYLMIRILNEASSFDLTVKLRGTWGLKRAPILGGQSPITRVNPSRAFLAWRIDQAGLG